MTNIVQNFGGNRALDGTHFSTVEWLGILIGIAMPVVSALAYPTYMHMMQTAWVEWSRLLEVPFVVCEIFVIFCASRKGMDSTQMWRSLPVDIKIGSAFLVIGIFASSLLISEYPLKSVTISLITIVHLLFAFAIYRLLYVSSIHDLRRFVMLLGAGLLSLAALTFWRFAFPPLPAEVPGGVIEWGAALPGFINVRHFGSWTGAIAAGFLVMMLYDSNKRQYPLVSFFYFLSIAMTIWSGTRAAILAIALTAFILALAKRELPTIRATASTAMLTGAAMTTAWILLPYNDPVFLLFDPGEFASAHALSPGRFDLWAATFQKWQESPVLGWGSGSTFWEVYAGWPHTQPHNAVLQFLITWGIVGAVAALWLLGRAVVKVHNVAVGTRLLLPLLAILYALLIMSLLEGMLHYPRFIMLIMFLFAAIMARDSACREVPSPS